MYHNHLLKEDKKMNLVCREAMLDLIIEFYKNNQCIDDSIVEFTNKLHHLQVINAITIPKDTTNKEVMTRVLDLIIEFYKNNESYENIDQEENKVESSNDINIEKLKKENKELLLRLVESKRTIYYLTSKETDRLNLWV